MRSATTQQTTVYLNTQDLSSLRRGQRLTLNASNGAEPIALAYERAARNGAHLNGSKQVRDTIQTLRPVPIKKITAPPLEHEAARVMPRRRKRKPMSKAVRAAISKRMRTYWAKQRQKKQK